MRRMIVLIGAAAMLFSCATVDDSPETAQGPPPDWVLGSLPSEGGYEFFIGSASDSTGDIAAAEAQATNGLIGEITRFVGVQVTSETSAEAKATLDSFEASVRQTVSQTSEAQVTGFRVVDRYVDQREDRVTVYLLGRYDRDELLAEQERIRAALQGT